MPDVDATRVSTYPTFAGMFAKSRYLTLLQPPRVGGPGSGIADALGVLDEALRTSPHVVHEVSAMLADFNWRPNLVAATAVIRARMMTGVVVRAVWTAIDRPSWVSPQLAVAASIIDPRFADGARARIAAASRGGVLRAAVKTLTALAVLSETTLPAVTDPDHGAEMALEWRRAMLVQYAPV